MKAYIKSALSWLHEMAFYVGHVSLFYVFRIFPIQNNKVVFSNYFGKGYGDNGKYIAESLLASGKDCEIVWLVRDIDAVMPSSIRKVRNGSLKAIYELCTAKVWIDNCRKLRYVRKRKKQFYIQTWHGDIGMKKSEKDAINSLSKNYIASAKNDSKMANLFVCGNRWMTNIYRSAYWYTGEIAECGYPRRDVFYNQNTELLKRIREELGIKEHEHLLLYAPTFRADTKNNENMSIYELDWPAVLNAMKERFGGEWRGLIRLHPNISRLADKLSLPSQVLNVTNYSDMQELMLVSDCIISDYSSSIFEFAVMKRPGFIHATDLEAYKKGRDLYFQFEELPFGISTSNEELLKLIHNFDENNYTKKLQEFYGERLHMCENGTASSYLVNRINAFCGN